MPRRPVAGAILSCRPHREIDGGDPECRDGGDRRRCHPEEQAIEPADGTRENAHRRTDRRDRAAYDQESLVAALALVAVVYFVAYIDRTNVASRR